MASVVTPQSNYYVGFTTTNPQTGNVRDADVLPTAVVNRNGADDPGFPLTVVRLDLGRYMASGVVPAGYQAGDIYNVAITATVLGVQGKAWVDHGVVDSKVSASDPWATALPGTYQAGTAGNILGARLDAAVSSRSTYAGGPVQSVTSPVTVGTNYDKAGYSLATAPPSAAQVAAAVWTDVVAGDFTAANSPGRILVGRLGGAFSGDTSQFTATALANAPGGSGGSGADPWLAMLPGAYAAGTAGYILGNRLDAAVSTRSTFAGGAVASVTLPVTVGTNNDKTGYALATAPPTAAQVATAVWTDTTPTDLQTAGSPGRILVQQLGGAFTPNVSVFTAAALANTPPGPAEPDPWTTVLPGVYASGSAGRILGAFLDAAVSSRSTYAGGPVASVTAPVTVGSIPDKTGFVLAPTGLDQIAITPPTGPATKFPQMLIQVWRRFFRRVRKDMATTTIRTYADNGTTVLTTQQFTDDSLGTEEVSAAT